MGKVFDYITDDIQAFIRKQHLFFVATAPLSGDGHINVSPKGMDCFRVLSKDRVAYLDLTGSGNETSAHITENGRITFMFCAFAGAPNIIRLYGTGHTVLPDTPEWDNLIDKFTLHLGTRQLIVADIHRVSTSCGYGVPMLDYKDERDTLMRYWQAKGEDMIPDYQQANNRRSIDGLEAPIAHRTKQTE